MTKIYLCLREREFIAGEINYQPILKEEKPQLNPKYIQRIRDYVANLKPPFILIARSPLIAILLDAGGFTYETLYAKL